MNKTIVPMDSVNKKIFERIRQVHKGKEFHTVEDLEELVQIPLDIAEAELSRCALTTAGLILKNYTFGHMMKKINRYPPQMFETPSPLVLLLDLEEGETRKFNFLGITCRYLSGL
ncbi:hypothetical protein KY308_00135, partial [Candidatus Woesearchaeota archaeon]|nr:hypothetical protein [Candidatus Woesearchaeota archaeon]